MKIVDIIESLDLELIVNNGNLEREVSSGYAGDLLSDVMGHAPQNAVWVTIQTHLNIAAVASLKDTAAIIIARGCMPEPDTIERCKMEQIALLRSKENTFEIAGKLYSLLK